MSTAEVSFKSSPVRAIQAVVSSPNWVMNLVWLSLATLLSSVFVGQIALFGYGAELIQRRAGRPGNPTPDIDSDRIGDYISGGIWPFVVTLIAQVAFGVLAAIPLVLVAIVGLVVASALGEDLGPVVAVVLAVPILLFSVAALNVCMVPFLIRAMVCQDFQRSFDIGWAMGFVKLMFWEVLISAMLFVFVSFFVVLAGMLVFCVGYIPAVGLISGAYMHMLSQWYEIYLNLGGQPAPARLEDTIVEATIV